MNLRVLLPACLALMLLIAGGCGREKEPETGRIEIHSTPAGAAVVFNGKQVGTTPKVFARAKTGHYRFRIEKPGYAPEWREVELTAKQPVVLEVPLTINGAAVLLTSEPAGAAVVIGQDRVGVTPLLLTDQAPGTCQAQLSCPGFADKTIQWTVVDSRPLEVICQLESRVGTMEIITRPEGARVLIAGAEAGVTPFTKNLEAGQYQVKIIKEGWDPVEETLYIQGGQKTGRTIDLKTEPGVISVVSEPAKAQIRVDGELRGAAPLVLRNCLPGIHQIRAELEGHDALERTVELAPGGEINLQLVLRRNTGEVAFKVNLKGAQVKLDGRPVAEVSDPGREITLPGLQPGKHQLEVSLAGADTEVITFRIEKARTIRLRPIELWRPNAEVKYRADGRVERGMIYTETAHDIVFGPEKGVKLQLSKSEFEYIKKHDFPINQP